MKPPLWWLSWWQPGDDYRPLTFPPAPEVLAYWCSGERRRGGIAESSVVALVRAEDEAAAWAAVRGPGAWPDAGEERFSHPYDGDGPPARFAPPAWSVAHGRWPWAGAHLEER